jgi:hypothetical protein
MNGQASYEPTLLAMYCISEKDEPKNYTVEGSVVKQPIAGVCCSW